MNYQERIAIQFSTHNDTAQETLQRLSDTIEIAATQLATCLLNDG